MTLGLHTATSLTVLVDLLKLVGIYYGTYIHEKLDEERKLGDV
jgi:hypothetical protein